jgi:hypothetical protein
VSIVHRTFNTLVSIGELKLADAEVRERLLSNGPLGQWRTIGGSHTLLSDDSIRFEADGSGEMCLRSLMLGEVRRRFRWRSEAHGVIACQPLPGEPETSEAGDTEAQDWYRIEYLFERDSSDTGTYWVMRERATKGFWDLVLPVVPAVTADRESTFTPRGTTRFRPPFTLNLHIDNEQYYQERFDETPYVIEGGVNLFKGDRFGVTLNVENAAVRAVAYQANIEAADITFDFNQRAERGGKAMMVLTIRNRTNHTILIDALMTVPGQQNAHATNLLPVGAGLTNYESWPHPIVQLLLFDFRLGEAPNN